MMQEGLVEYTPNENAFEGYESSLVGPIRNGKVFQFINFQAATTKPNNRKAITQLFSEESFEKNLTAFMNQQYKGQIKLNFQGATNISEKIIQSAFPEFNYQQYEYLTKCLEDDWLFFIHQFGYQDIFDFSVAELKKTSTLDNTTLIHFLNYFGSQKTLDKIFENRVYAEDSNNNNNNTSFEATDLCMAIYCNQLEFLKQYFQDKNHKNDLTKEHLELAFELRNDEMLQFLSSQNKDVCKQFEDELSSKEPGSILRKIVKPCFSQSSQKLLDFCAKKIKNFYGNISLESACDLFENIDINSANKILSNSKSLKNPTKKQKLELIRSAYIGGNLTLAFYLEWKFSLEFVVVFDDLKHAHPEAVDKVLMFLSRANDDRFSIALSLVKDKSLQPSSFPLMFASSMRCQDMTNLKLMFTIFKDKKDDVVNALIKLTFQSESPHLFFETFSKLLSDKKLDLNPVLLCQKFIKLGEEENKTPAFFLSFLFFMQQHKCLTFINDSFFSGFLLSWTEKVGDFPFVSETQLQKKEVFQELFDSISRTMWNSQLPRAEELEDFFAYLLRQNVISWNVNFNNFIWQPRLMTACIQNVFFFSTNAKEKGLEISKKLFLTGQDTAIYLSYFSKLENAFKTSFLTASDTLISIFSELYKNKGKKLELSQEHNNISMQWLERLPEIVRAHFTLEQAEKLLLIFLGVHLDDEILNGRTKEELQFDSALFQAICNVIDVKFFALNKQRAKILSCIDQFLAVFLRLEGGKIESADKKCLALFEKINYLCNLILKYTKTISFPVTDQYFQKENLGFKKLLDANDVKLMTTRQKQEINSISNGNGFVLLEEDENNNNKHTTGSNGAMIVMMQQAQQQTKTATEDQSKLEEDGFTRLEIDESPKFEPKPKKSVFSSCLAWMRCGAKQIEEDAKQEDRQTLTPKTPK